MAEREETISLKWGTLKSWDLFTEESLAIIKKYGELGSTISCMAQQDTDEQKELICQLIDRMPGDIFLDWDCKYISKDEAKNYVKNYGKN